MDGLLTNEMSVLLNMLHNEDKNENFTWNGRSFKLFEDYNAKTWKRHQPDVANTGRVNPTYATSSAWTRVSFEDILLTLMFAFLLKSHLITQNSCPLNHHCEIVKCVSCLHLKHHNTHH